MEKILFVAPNLNPGGAEKVLVTIVNNLSKMGFNCSLVLLSEKGKLLSSINPEIKVIEVKGKNIFSRLHSLKCIIKDNSPEVVFSIIGHVNIMLSFLKIIYFREITFIGRENAVHSIWFKKNKNLKKSLLYCSYKIFLKHLDTIIAQSEFMKKDINEMFAVKENQISVISNPIDFDSIEENSNLPLDKSVKWDFDKQHIISVGRLETVKDYPRMFNIIKNLSDDYILDVFGEGKEKESLNELIKRNKLQDKIILHGYNNNVYRYMKLSNFLILTSERESFPNVILEANTCGIPALCLEIPGGIREVISEDEINGKVFADECDLIDYIAKEKYLHFHSCDIKKYISDNFSLEAFLKKILVLIKKKERFN
ncbi:MULTISPECIES: glycosyltransferase [unclassified Enterococcus]|uniref:glycosyltransferase n=1 Tax=unclassified Enterococcus TaxID=2608891 RepID=UPI0010F01D56|nr:group 1 glycosyl transferase [Enterococcus casseliflavus]